MWIHPKIQRIVAELAELLEQQMRTLSGRSIDALPDDEITAYNERTARIPELRSQLAKFARPM